mgnify:CR=1 FL=1
MLGFSKFYSDIYFIHLSLNLDPWPQKNYEKDSLRQESRTNKDFSPH